MHFLDPKLKASTFLEFFDAGNNLLVAADIDITKQFRYLFNSLGVEIDELVKLNYLFFPQKIKRVLKFMTISTTLIQLMIH